MKPHKFKKHHFRSPRWCDTCKKFIYGIGFQVIYWMRDRKREGGRERGSKRKRETKAEKEREREARNDVVFVC
jgi:hypothetical protein